MPHFAKLDNNNVVIAVTVGSAHDDGKEVELSERTGDVYKQTSYNTRGGVHYDPETGEPSADQSKAFRYNYAGVGFTFDETIGDDGAFIPPKPFESFVLDPLTCQWTTPVPMPDDGKDYSWDKKTNSWVEVPGEAL